MCNGGLRRTTSRLIKNIERCFVCCRYMAYILLLVFPFSHYQLIFIQSLFLCSSVLLAFLRFPLVLRVFGVYLEFSVIFLRFSCLCICFLIFFCTFSTYFMCFLHFVRFPRICVLLHCLHCWKYLLNLYSTLEIAFQNSIRWYRMVVIRKRSKKIEYNLNSM